jgi:energy-coupling factor transport system substrate-specific component
MRLQVRLLKLPICQGLSHYSSWWPMTRQPLISKLSIAVAAIASILMFAWPLLIATDSQNENLLAQAVFLALMPMIIVITLVEFATGEIGSRQLAILGVMTAINAVVRLLGAGTAGIETAFFLIIIGAYVFRSGFGFILGSSSILVSALLGAGVGPWLPFQMMAAGLVGIGAGALPRFKPKAAQLLTLCLYAVFASFVYGALMTLWNWPFLAGGESSVSYLAGAGLGPNLLRFLNYEIVTGGFLWDAGRAVTTCALILIAAPALLATLRRAANRGGFEN